MSDYSWLKAHLSSAVEGVIGSIELAHDSRLSPSDAWIVGASIGFSGPKGAGSMVIWGDFALYEKSHPLAGVKVLERDEVLDWTGEVCNQILGRVKNQLGRENVTVFMATPNVFAGKNVTLGRANGDVQVEGHFRHPGGSFAVRFDCESKLLDERTEPEAGTEMPEEGDLMLF